MKKSWVFLIMLLLCIPNALGESDGYWTSNGDWYYHACEFCGGAEDMVPISAAGAAEFGKYACPVCVPTQESGEIQVTECFGYLALRIPDAWVARQENPELPRLESDPAGVNGKGAQALETLGMCLHGEDYARFMEKLRASGSAEAIVTMPQVLPVEDAVVISMRHIGDAWYACVRPEKNPEEGWDLMLGLTKLEMKMEGGELQTEVPYRLAVKSFPLMPEQITSAAEPMLQRTEEGMLIRVIQLADESYNFSLTGSISEFPERARLRVDGVELECEFEAWRYEDAPDHLIVLCSCALTEAEFRALEAGAPIEFTDLEGNKIAFSGYWE